VETDPLEFQTFLYFNECVVQSLGSVQCNANPGIREVKISHGNVNRVERIWAGKGEAALRLIFLETHYEYI
jgi:hypothetical protein